MPSAIGRSKRPDSFGRSAGARLTVIRRIGNSKRLLSRAARTRSRASRTSVSGRPTSVNAGRPLARWTSTVTSGAAMPLNPRLRTTANVMRGFIGRKRPILRSDGQPKDRIRGGKEQGERGQTSGVGSGRPRNRAVPGKRARSSAAKHSMNIDGDEPCWKQRPRIRPFLARYSDGVGAIRMARYIAKSGSRPRLRDLKRTNHTCHHSCSPSASSSP